MGLANDTLIGGSGYYKGYGGPGTERFDPSCEEQVQ
jgi:hypothetical protein